MHQSELPVEKRFPTIKVLFMKIAEPRTLRVLLFCAYICMGVTGVRIALLPRVAEGGSFVVFGVWSFIAMLMCGAIFSAFAVLPGIWWLERVGLILLGSSLLIYLVIIINQRGWYVGISIILALGFLLSARWVDIKGAALAPEGE